MTAAGKKYSDVKGYIENVTNDIPEKSEQLAVLEAAFADTDARALQFMTEEYNLDRMFERHDYIAGILNDFITTADGCKTTVEEAVKADNNNTKAYNEMTAAITAVEAKLAEAKDKAAQYKYATSFPTQESQLATLKNRVENAKVNGSAVAYQNGGFVSLKNSLDTGIENELSNAFAIEKAGLANDITELKNQYNTYVAANGLNDTAIAYKKAIDNLEKALNELEIVEVDKPADGIKFNDIIAATDKLIALQKNIADKQTELLAANANAANATVLADFNSQLDALAGQASLDGYDEWVGQQTLNGKTLDEQIKTLNAQIAELRAAIKAEPNISFFKDKYQEQIEAVEKALTPVTDAITAKQAQFAANAEAYERLTAQINELQGKIDAAKEKVSAYEYAAGYYNYSIEQVQTQLNSASADIETSNYYKQLGKNSVVANAQWMEAQIQQYLDDSANAELNAQNGNLNNLLSNAIDAKYKAQTYSNALWGRLIAEKSGILDDINALGNEIYKSHQARTSDADYAAQMETVAAIKAKIADLSAAVDNLGLLGDANEDGKVNVLDYQKVTNMILDPSLQPEEASDLFVNIDVNQNEVIEVGDLTAVVNYILNRNWQGWAAARGMNATDERLAMSVSSLD